MPRCSSGYGKPSLLQEVILWACKTRRWNPSQPLRPSQIADLRLAASNMTGPTRRAFQAEMALKYCGGNPLLAETIFGWGRHTVEVGLAERRTGIMCLGAQSAFSGRKRWEDTHPEAAAALRRLAEAHAQQDPTFRTTLAYTRLTAKAALEALRAQGYECGAIALAQYDGRGAQSHGISAAQSGQSQTTKEDCRDRCHFRQYVKKRPTSGGSRSMSNG